MGGISGVYISDDYRALLYEMHAMRSWGDGGHKYARDVRRIACHIGAVSILDYGCGVGTLKTSMPEFQIMEYDPCVIGKEQLPEPADLVVCTDVLEHVEPEYLASVLSHICTLSIMGCFAVISTRPAHSHLPDDSNAHRIIQDYQWWMNRLLKWPWLADVEHRGVDQMNVWLRKKW